VGNAMTVAEIVEKVTPYKPFFETSGGGVTLSGGEPTMHMQFLSSLLKALKQEHIHTLLETSGLFNYARFEEIILPYLDAVYIDIKIIDPTWHRRYCGVSNERIIANLARLQSVSSKGTFTLLPRTPLIPGITDSKQQITALASFYRDHHLTSAVLLPNNPIWIEKCARLGYPEPYDKTSPVRDFYDLAKKRDIETIFSQHGIAVTFG
jgi:pyruvate formate lyase activating enzyme